MAKGYQLSLCRGLFSCLRVAVVRHGIEEMPLLQILVRSSKQVANGAMANRLVRGGALGFCSTIDDDDDVKILGGCMARRVGRSAARSSSKRSSATREVGLEAKGKRDSLAVEGSVRERDLFTSRFAFVPSLHGRCEPAACMEADHAM